MHTHYKQGDFNTTYRSMRNSIVGLSSAHPHEPLCAFIAAPQRRLFRSGGAGGHRDKVRLDATSSFESQKRHQRTVSRQHFDLVDIQ
eukprot:6200352-Pleurochrysis_carterae.AAC.1